MTDPIRLGDADGTIVFEVDGRPFELDLYDAYSRLADLSREYADRPRVEFYQGVLALMEGYGMPRKKLRAAELFANAVMDRVAALGNGGAGGPTPGSPASTAPPPSSCPPIDD